MAEVDFDKGVKLQVTGLTYFAKLTEESGQDVFKDAKGKESEPKWATGIILSKKSLTQLEQLGVFKEDEYFMKETKPKEDRKQVQFIKAATKDKPSVYVKNESGEMLLHDGLIGNKSKIVAEIVIKRYDMGRGKTGLTAYLGRTVYIHELVEYGGASIEEMATVGEDDFDTGTEVDF